MEQKREQDKEKDRLSPEHDIMHREIKTRGPPLFAVV
jgi:hypothetical protein